MFTVPLAGTPCEVRTVNPVKLTRPSMFADDAAFIIKNGAVPLAEILALNVNGVP
jgi:hypothetical protein